MATDAFLQAGSGEVAISAVLALKAKSFWTLDEKKIEADLYEDKHPGVTVKRDWESPAEFRARVKKREAIELPAAPTQGMDPGRAMPELLRQRRAMAGLTPSTEKSYSDRFDALEETIHMLEDTCGLKRTEYKKGLVPKKEKETADPAAMAKLAEYFKRNLDTRRRSIEATSDVAFLTLIRDTEMTPELQTLAQARITQESMKP